MNLERNRYKPYLIPFRIVVAFVMLASALFAWQTSDRQAEFYAGGAPDSPVKIEVFSDYQCPACRTFFLDTIRPILAGYSSSNKVSVVYRDFPLDAAQAAVSATSAHELTASLSLTKSPVI